MAISNYTELKQAVIDWSHQDDIDTRVDNFILLAENYMYNNEYEQLEVANIENTTTATVDELTEALPTGYISMRKVSLTLNDSEWKLLSRTPDTIEQYGVTGVPTQYAVTGTNITFDKTPDQAYTATYVYYGKPTGISSSNTTNAVLTNHPLIYLYGCLHQLAIYNDDLEMQGKYQQLFISAIRGANDAAENQRLGSSPSSVPMGMIV